MGIREQVPLTYERSTQDSQSNAASIHLRSTELSEPVDWTFEALRPGLFRTTFSSQTRPLPPFPNAQRPAAEDSSIATEQKGDSSQTFTAGDVEATVDWSAAPLVSIGFKGQEPLYHDLPHRSYAVDGTGIAHYTRYQRGSLHVGLGEKAAPMDLSNRQFQISATDSFGYDVQKTDPMYKHIPLMIRATPEGVIATLSTSHALGKYSVGGEMDGMWGFFKVYRQDHGGLEQYTMVGKTLQDVVTMYAELVGFPILVPRWAYGYLGGGYKYAMLDNPPAPEAFREFCDKLKEHDIPCSGFQMSSGYHVHKGAKARQVFNWNRERFPEPEKFCNDMHANGIRLLANIKPYILASHPEYERLAKAGAIFTDPNTKEAATCRLWSSGGGTSAVGGHLDFTSKAAWDFWYKGVRQLRKEGMDCMWNDNNEYTIPNDDWMLSLSDSNIKEALTSSQEKRKDVGLWGRAMHTELMGKCSHDALLDEVPNERPFVLTRSATPGTMKYAGSSWSGDNVTSWEGMRGANAISLTAGMCLLQCYGHDIGGFEGPQPSSELLVRWVQLGCHSPRFAINCFKTSTADNMVGEVIEPWMYPEVIPQLRSAIRRRYEMIPYLYGSMLQSHYTAVPPQRWIGWGYETTDSEIWNSKLLKDGETQYWLGDTLLVGGVYEPGLTEAKMYLPKKTMKADDGFLNTNAPYQFLPAGQWVTIHSQWKEHIPVLAKVGGLVPVGKDSQVAAPGDKQNEGKHPADDFRGVEIFPPPEERSDGETEYVNSWMEDDGFSPPPAKVAEFTVKYKASASEVSVAIESDCKAFTPPWLEHGLSVILPVGDNRRVVAAAGKAKVEERRVDIRGRKRFHLSV